MEIEVGKYYLTKDGAKVFIAAKNEFSDEDSMHYYIGFTCKGGTAISFKKTGEWSSFVNSKDKEGYSWYDIDKEYVEEEYILLYNKDAFYASRTFGSLGEIKDEIDTILSNYSHLEKKRFQIAKIIE
jgi:hypothetical protein